MPDRPDLARPLRILLADDHVTVRHGLRLLIDGEPDMTVVAEAGDDGAAVRQALELKPDVVVMDISMPGMNGLAATRALRKARPDAVIVTLTRHGDDAYLQELLRAGVSGYVLKRSAPTELLQAIRAVAAGGQYLDSTLTPRITAGFINKQGGRARPASNLTDREIVRDVDALTSEAQCRLLKWLDAEGNRTQVVSTASAPLLPLVESRAFNDALYYRLNTVHIDLSD